MSNSNGKHIMLSYAWTNNREKVDDVARKFETAGVPIWMDVRNGLGPNLIDGMAEAVEQSLAVCYFPTPEYQESKCCKMELEYANQLNIPIIPCYLTNFRPRKWLGLLTAGRIHYDFSNDFYDTNLNQLIRYIKRNILKVDEEILIQYQYLSIDREIPVISSEQYVSKSAVGTSGLDVQNSPLQHNPVISCSALGTHSMSSANPRQVPAYHRHIGRESSLMYKKTPASLRTSMTNLDQQTRQIGKIRLPQKFQDYI